MALWLNCINSARRNYPAKRVVSNTPQLHRRIPLSVIPQRHCCPAYRPQARRSGQVQSNPWTGTVWYKVDSDLSHLHLTPIADVTKAADQVAIFRGWLKGQMDAQKAKIMAMSEQFSIPIPNLEVNPFDPSPLSLIKPSAGNAVATSTNKTMPQESKKKYVFDERKVPSA